PPLLVSAVPVPCERVGVVYPVNGVRRALLVGQIRCAGSGIEKNPVFLLDEVGDGQRNTGIGHVDNDVDLVDVEPLAHDIDADVRLVLVIARNDVDLPALATIPESSTAICAASVEPG